MSEHIYIVTTDGSGILGSQGIVYSGSLYLNTHQLLWFSIADAEQFAEVLTEETGNQWVPIKEKKLCKKYNLSVSEDGYLIPNKSKRDFCESIAAEVAREVHGKANKIVVLGSVSEELDPEDLRSDGPRELEEEEYLLSLHPKESPNETVDGTVTETIDETIDETVAGTVAGTVDKTIDETIDETVAETVDGTVAGTVDGNETVSTTPDETVGQNATPDETVNATSYSIYTDLDAVEKLMNAHGNMSDQMFSVLSEKAFSPYSQSLPLLIETLGKKKKRYIKDDSCLSSDSESYKKEPLPALLLEMIGDICDYIEKIDEIRISLSRGLILVNREIEDELHYMEFNDLNAAMGWASYRRLKELRRKRREIKDAIDLLAQASPVLRPLDLTNILTLKRYIESRSTRSYQLRAPDQFFEEHPELQKKAREKVEENEKTSD